MSAIAVAGGILIASIPYWLIKAGYKVLKQDEFEWIGSFDKLVGFLLIFFGLVSSLIIIFASYS